MRLAARVALVALLLLRARAAEDHAAASRRLEPTRAPAPPVTLDRGASRARVASVISELARGVRWVAELCRRRASERASGGAIRQRADQTLAGLVFFCLLYTSPSPRDATLSRMPSSA